MCPISASSANEIDAEVQPDLHHRLYWMSRHARGQAFCAIMSISLAGLRSLVDGRRPENTIANIVGRWPRSAAFLPRLKRRR
jgi:hypothetical protein